MRYLYARPNQMLVLTGWWEPTKLITHGSLILLDREGYIDVYFFDLGAFTLMKVSAVVIPFTLAYELWFVPSPSGV